MPKKAAAGKKRMETSCWKSVYEEPPRKHVLLLTCMDQRLLDDIVQFMNGLNLQNRYDQVILAGASMGALRLPEKTTPKWKQVFFDHLVAAINVLHRDIKDIFLLEHLDCGAYKYLHPDDDVQKAYFEARELSELVVHHSHEVLTFADEVRRFCIAQQEKARNDTMVTVKQWQDIRVRSFLMDLIGNVHEFDDQGKLHPELP